MKLLNLKQELKQLGDPKQAKLLARFFNMKKNSL
jgi:hypothetical protein